MAGPENLGALIAPQPDATPWLVEIAPDGTERTFTYGDLRRRTAALARGLVARGLRRGQRVGILAGNSAEYLLAYFGVMQAGLCAVPINIKLPAETLAHIARDSDLALLLADAERMAAARPLAPVAALERLHELEQDGDLAAVDMAGGEFATILYTSGSTGRPKGVPLLHGPYVWAVRSLVDGGPRLGGKTGLVAAPLFHMNGLVSSSMLAYAGATEILLQRFTPVAYLEAIARHRCFLLTSVPTMLALVAREQAAIARLDLSSVEMIATGSAPSTEALFDRVAEIFPRAMIQNSWGTTESGPVAFGPHPAGLKRPKLSVGHPAPQVEVRLVDGPGPDEGVLHIRTPTTMPGYLNLADETARRIRDGWYDTGDVMRRDANGFFYFVGRADDMFVCGGENIYPGEVEKLLERHPGVAQAAVVPAPDEIKGQIPVAFVVPRPGLAPGAEELKRHALAHAPAYMHPRFVEFVAELPLAGTNKVDRRALLARAEKYRR